MYVDCDDLNDADSQANNSASEPQAPITSTGSFCGGYARENLSVRHQGAKQRCLQVMTPKTRGQNTAGQGAKQRQSWGNGLPPK